MVLRLGVGSGALYLMSKLSKSIYIWIYLLRLALHHCPTPPHLVRQALLYLVLHHLPRIASGVDEVMDLVKEVVDVSLTIAQPVPFLDRIVSGQALTKARLHEGKKGTPFPEAVVLIKLYPLPGHCIPIDINMDVFIPFLRLPFFFFFFILFYSYCMEA